MPKIDLKKELKHLYRPSAKEVVQVDVPAFRFLMIDGEGDPNASPAYAQAVEAFVEAGILEGAIEKVKRKKALPAIDSLRVEEFAERICAQVLHVGPFSEEDPTIEGAKSPSGLRWNFDPIDSESHESVVRVRDGNERAVGAWGTARTVFKAARLSPTMSEMSLPTCLRCPQPTRSRPVDGD